MKLLSRSLLQSGVAPLPSKSQPQKRKYRRFFTILIFLLPSILLFGLLVLLPVVQAMYYSFFTWNGFDPLTNFVGLKNYQTAFQNPVFLGALWHNLIILVLSLIFQLSLALALALIIGKKMPGRSIFRAIFFMPFILSDVVAGVIWSFIFRPDGGINALFHQQQLWLANPDIVLFSLFIVILWKYFGLHLVLYVAAIQDIPDELIEAARIDGATRLQAVRYVSLPLLGSTIRMTIFLSALGSLQFFDLIWVMTGGGPVNASTTMATYLYKDGFLSVNMGYGSAVGVSIFLVCFLFSVLYQRFVMQRDLAGSITEPKSS